LRLFLRNDRLKCTIPLLHRFDVGKRVSATQPTTRCDQFHNIADCCLMLPFPRDGASLHTTQRLAVIVTNSIDNPDTFIPGQTSPRARWFPGLHLQRARNRQRLTVEPEGQQ
jgi:hypothetical protein